MTPICLLCWRDLNPFQAPTRTLTNGPPPVLECGFCGHPTTAGVFVKPTTNTTEGA